MSEALRVTELHVGESFVSAKSGVTLTVADVFGRQSVGTTRVYATQDGKTFHRGVWHEGAEESTVWAEVWSVAGCEFHGTVDSVSRKVCQVG